jgi:hemoglobin-like flavoprotein
MTAPRPPQLVGRPDPTTASLVQTSCELVSDRPVVLAERFYAHLFAMAPDVRAMFPPDMTLQTEKLCAALLDAVRSLDNPEAMETQLSQLGAAHRSMYGVTADHYVYVGHALVRAVRDVSGHIWTTQLSSAWILVYEWIAAHMTANTHDSTTRGRHATTARSTW